MRETPYPKTARRRRREAAWRGVATKRAAALAQADAVELALPELEIGELLRQAARHSADGKDAPEGSDPVAFAVARYLERLAVNHARHNLTPYNAALEALRGHVGKTDAIGRLRARIFDAISEAWPDLREECRRQAAKVLRR